MKKFDNWNKIKKEIDNLNDKKYFYERDVWFTKLGCNVGFEQDGNGGDFLRPVLVYKKFSRSLFLGMPLTKVIKKEKFYFSLKLRGEKTSVILSQIKLIDSKRLEYKIGKISGNELIKIKKQFIELTQ